MIEARELKVVNVRLVKEPSLYSPEPVSSPEDVLRVIADALATYDREVFAILNLQSNGQIINMNICSIGTLDASMVSPREVFKSCILSNAASFIAIHNHPSGRSHPSSEDISVTKRLKECGELFDIRLLDHIIVGGATGEMFSFCKEGLMDDLRNRDSWER